MKKLLLFTMLTISLGLNAQVLLSDNFTSLTVGNVGTAITGATAGQGGYYTDCAGGANTDCQISNAGGIYGNVFQLSGSATAVGNKFIWKDGLDVNWAARTSGNNIIEVEFDLYTGLVSTSKNVVQVGIYDSTYGKKIVGLQLAMDTKILSGLAWFTNTATPPVTGNFIFGLGPSTTIPNLVLTADSWVKVGFSFNKTTGAIKWKGPSLNAGVTGAAIGIDPFECDYISVAGTGNTVSSTAKFDNFIARASATDTLLGTEKVSLDSSKFSISPNPASDFVNISNSENIKVSSVKITDLNGRVVKQSNFDSVSDIKMNVSDLSSGIYMMNINSNEGSVTKKIIKN